jgi:MurNAc alpha-1-phosphate uridylyltransferase
MTKRPIPTPSNLATALLLAAGRGERMRPLTDATPKPLLPVRGQPLMQWTMQGLQRGGIQDLVINTAWLGEQIPQHFGSVFDSAGQAPMHLHYSQEGVDFGGALETAGGIARALPQLADVFWVAAGDVFAPDFVFAPEVYESFKTSPQLAHLWLVPNPEHNLGGDFGLSVDGLALNLPSAKSCCRHQQHTPKQHHAPNKTPHRVSHRWGVVHAINQAFG